MATTVLDITFTANVIGAYNIYYSVNGGAAQGPVSYTVTILGIQTVPAITVSPSLTNASCNPVVITGWIQPTCQATAVPPVAGWTGAQSFSQTFTPVRPCTSYSVQCTSVEISSIQVTNPGSGYSSAPIVTTTPTMTLDSATAHVGAGGVLTFSHTSGSGLTPGTYLAQATTGGTGTGAIFDVVIGVGGTVTSLVLNSASTAPGSGYVAPTDVLTFTNGALAGISITVLTVNTGQIQYISFNQGGDTFTSIPTVNISTGSATASAIMSPCPELDYTSCASVSEVIPTGQILGGSPFVICTNSLPTAPRYTLTTADCCYNCVEMTITNSSSVNSIVVKGISCSTLNQVSNTLAPSTSIGPICLVVGSVYTSLGGQTGITIVTGSSCTS